MKKIVLLWHLFLAICVCQEAFASEGAAISASNMSYVNHIIVNNDIGHGDWMPISFELRDPSGELYKGMLYPGTKSIFLDANNTARLPGTYVFHVHQCYFMCHAYSQSLYIGNNADVIWTINSNGITVEKTDL